MNAICWSDPEAPAVASFLSHSLVLFLQKKKRAKGQQAILVPILGIVKLKGHCFISLLVLACS